MKYSVLGISSGLGVSLFPFKDNLIANIEGRGIFHTPKNEQWIDNFGNIPLYKSLEILQNEKFKPNIIISSPDCGSGSIFRLSRAKKFGDHTKNDSLMGFFVGIRKFNPEFFLFENLNGLFKSFPKERFMDLTSNYRLIIHNATVAHWGNSQINRKRLIIIGIRRDLPKKLGKYFKLPHYKEPKTCQELYGDLGNITNPSISHIREPLDEVISIHARKRMSLGEIALHWKRLPGKKRWITEPGFNFSTAPGVYRNLKNDFPATARKANRQFDHYGLTLSPRQLARIQGIPDEFIIHYEDSKPKYWINKGRTVVTKTPPYEISSWFKIKVEKAFKSLARVKDK